MVKISKYLYKETETTLFFMSTKQIKSNQRLLPVFSFIDKKKIDKIQFKNQQQKYALSFLKSIGRLIKIAIKYFFCISDQILFQFITLYFALY